MIPPIRTMSPGQPSETNSHATPKPGDPMSVCVLVKPHAVPDEELALVLARELRARGHTVLLDKRQTPGLVWVKNLEAQIRQSDLVVPLLSEISVQSEMLTCEVEMADQAAQKQDGWPHLL